MDTYVTQLRILYSSFLEKPVLQVIPSELDYSFYPQATYPPDPQFFPLKITHLHPASEVTNFTVDSSQLDLATTLSGSPVTPPITACGTVTNPGGIEAADLSRSEGFVGLPRGLDSNDPIYSITSETLPGRS